MSAAASSSATTWYWSQRGISMGPVSFAELLRLVELRSITATTWVYHPQQATWVQAQSIAELADAMRKATAEAPPSGAPPEVVYCSFCGAAGAARANHCVACGRRMAVSETSGEGSDLASVLCRVSVLVTAVVPVLPIVVPAIVWAADTRGGASVDEAKRALSCHIVLALGWLFAGWLAVFGLLIIVGPCISALLACALVIYSLVAGVLGLVALGQPKPFEYPLMPRLIR